MKHLTNNNIEISVIITNRNGEKYIFNCIQSVLKEKNQRYKVIVVDDGSVDNSTKIIKQFSQHKQVSTIFLNESKGVAKARNIGVANSSSKYLLFLDLDTEIPPGWYTKISSFFKRNTKTGVGLVKLMRIGTSQIESTGELINRFGLLIERYDRKTDHGQFNTEDYVFSGKTAGMIVRRQVFDKLRGFDEAYEIYMEDTDFCWRTWLAGYYVKFTPSIIVYHAYGTKPKSYYKYHDIYFRGSRNTLNMHLKNLELSRLFLVLPVQYMIWFAIATMSLFKGDYKKASGLFSGIFASILWIPQTLIKRSSIQSERKITDEELFRLISVQKPLVYYLKKGLNYVDS